MVSNKKKKRLQPFNSVQSEANMRRGSGSVSEDAGLMNKGRLAQVTGLVMLVLAVLIAQKSSLDLPDRFSASSEDELEPRSKQGPAKSRPSPWSSSSFLNRLMNEMEQNKLLKEVRVELPRIDTEPMEFAIQLDTMNFMDFVNGSDGRLTLVSFFDPRSESFLVTKKDLDKSAALISNSVELREKAAIATVNAALDPYLQMKFSPEMVATWQEDEEDSEENFLFGKKNFFPLVTKIFKKGVVIAEYTGSIRPKEIQEFLRLQIASNLTVISQLDQAWDFVDVDLPVLLGCYPAGNASCEIEESLFRNFTESKRGWMLFGLVRQTEICEALREGFTECSLMVKDRSGAVGIFPRLQPNLMESGIQEYNEAMNSFIKISKDPIFIEMTPDNSWNLIESFDVIVVLLADFEDQENFQKAQRIIKKARTEDKTSNEVKFTFANGRNFASQFQIAMEELPTMIIYFSERDHVEVYPAVKDLSLRNAQDENKAAKQVADWLRRTLAGGEASNGSNTKRNEATESLENKEMETTEDNERSMTIDHMDWKRMGKMNIDYVMNYAPMDEIWTGMMGLISEMFLFQEAFHTLPLEEQRHDENVLLKHAIENFYRYIGERRFLQWIVDALPETPIKLQRQLENESERITLWQNIQMMSFLKAKLVEEEEESSRMAFAEVYAELWSMRVGIMRNRTIAVRRRFLREKGREPDESDRKIQNIERRSGNDLSMEEFINEFAKKRKPVIITDLKLFKKPWNKEFVKRKCGHHFPEYVQKAEITHKWGGLVKVKEHIDLKSFLETHTTNETRKKWYLHDWGLPTNCPEIMGQPPFEEFIFPRYFAGDYFQRMPFIGYQHSWPSLFVGANGTESAMHVDSGEGIFGCTLFLVKKNGVSSIGCTSWTCIRSRSRPTSFTTFSGQALLTCRWSFERQCFKGYKSLAISFSFPAAALMGCETMMTFWVFR